MSTRGLKNWGAISIFCVVALAWNLKPLQAEDPPKAPEVLMCVPLGGVAGQTTKIKARGLRLDGSSEVRCNIPVVQVKFLGQGKASVPATLNAAKTGDTYVEFELTLPAELTNDLRSASELELEFVASHGATKYRLPLSDLKHTILEVEPNPGFAQSQKIEPEQTVLGQIDKPLDVDVYSVELTQGQSLRLQTRAQCFGSAVDTRLSILDANGNAIASNDDCNETRDSQLDIVAPHSGIYFVVVQDANDLGGEAQPYRLSLEPQPAPISFMKQIAPILQQRCLACHGPRKSEGGYRVDTYDRLMAAGDSGQHGFVANSTDQSESFRRFHLKDAEERMPLRGEPLSSELLALIQKWLETGATFDGISKSTSLLAQMPPVRYPNAPESYNASVPITAMNFNANGNEIIVAGYHELTVWDTNTGKLLRRIGDLGERTYKIAIHPNGNLLAVASGDPGLSGDVRMFDPNGKLDRVLGVASDCVLDVAFSPNGELVAVAGSDAAIRIYDVGTGGLKREITSHLDWVMSVAWSPDATKVASASRDKTSKVFDVQTGQMLASYARHESPVRGVLFHPSGLEIYSSGANQKWERWLVQDAKFVRDMHLGGDAFQLTGVGEFFLVPSSNNRVHWIKADDSQKVQEFQASMPGRFLSASAHLGSDRIAAGTHDGRVVVWELSSGKELIRFKAAP